MFTQKDNNKIGKESSPLIGLNDFFLLKNKVEKLFRKEIKIRNNYSDHLRFEKENKLEYKYFCEGP